MIAMNVICFGFEERIYTPTPNEQSRANILKLHLDNTKSSLTENDIKALAKATQGLVLLVMDYRKLFLIFPSSLQTLNTGYLLI